MATSPEAGHEASGVFPPFDASSFPSQLFWLAITFGVLYLFMSRVVLPRVGGAIERRTNKITQDLEDAARLNDEATDAQRALEVKLAEARARARETAAKTKAEIDSEIAAETAKVEAEVEAKIASAATRIAQSQAEAMKKVEETATTVASALVNKLTGLDVSDADAAKAVSSVVKGS